jgi:hypothetical protein
VLRDHIQPISGISVLIGLFAWIARRFRKSLDGLDDPLDASIKVRGTDESLRRAGVPDADRQELIKAFWRKHHGLPLDPPT